MEHASGYACPQMVREVHCVTRGSTSSSRTNRSSEVLELYLERPWHAACRARASLGALRIQRLEGIRSRESVLCIFYRIATSGLDRRTSVADDLRSAELGGDPRL